MTRRRGGYHPALWGDDLGDPNEPTLKAQGFYHTPAWRRLRKQALIRDKYLCRECLRHGVLTPATEVHHIIRVEDDRSKALDIDNLLSLCWECHEKTKDKTKHKVSKPSQVRVIKIDNGQRDREL